MKMQFIPVKAVTAGERAGSLQCTNHFLRTRMMAHLRALKGVHEVKRIAWNIIYFETDEGINAKDVLEAVHIVLPVFAAEMQVLRPWLQRNFWILWGIVFGIMRTLNVMDALMGRDFSFGIYSWLAGFFIIVISLMNYQIGRKREEALLAYVRQERIKRIEEDPSYGQCPD